MTVLCTGVRTQKRVCCSHSDVVNFNKSFGTFLAEVVICWKCVALANVDISIKKVLDSVVFIYSVASPSHECFHSGSYEWAEMPTFPGTVPQGLIQP